MNNEFLQFEVKSLYKDGNCEVTLVIKTQSMTDAFDLIQNVKQHCEPEQHVVGDDVKNLNVGLRILTDWTQSNREACAYNRLNAFSKRIVATISFCKTGGLALWTWDIQLPTRVEYGTSQTLQNAKADVDIYLEKIGYTLNN